MSRDFSIKRASTQAAHMQCTFTMQVVTCAVQLLHACVLIPMCTLTEPLGAAVTPNKPAIDHNKPTTPQKSTIAESKPHAGQTDAPGLGAIRRPAIHMMPLCSMKAAMQKEDQPHSQAPLQEPLS
jgi:hypothetical protein